MELEAIILSGTIFGVIILLAVAGNMVYASWKSERDLLKRTEKWCHKSDGGELAAGRKRDEAAKSRQGMRALWLFLGLPGVKKSAKPQSIYSGTPLFYQRAGIYDASSLRSYQLLRYVLFALPFFLLGFVHLVGYRAITPQLLLLGFLFAYIGYFLPVLWLRIRARSRKRELDRTFPDAIDLMMVCVEAGMGLDSAIRRVAHEIHVASPELAKEFRILSLELKSGKTRNICLKNLAQRANLPEIDNLVSLLIQAERYGTGVANALRVHAEEMRQKRYARLEEMAAKLPVKLVVPLVFCIFPALFVVILGPGAIRIFRELLKGVVG